MDAKAPDLDVDNLVKELKAEGLRHPQDEYKVLGALGKGKFATVYKAERNGQPYALKRVAIFEMLNAKSRDKCLREVRLLQGMNHPNILRFIDAWIDPERNDLVIILEWAAGGDLRNLIKHIKSTRRAFAERQVWRYCNEIAEGLKHMHSKRVMHRDLKCANIMLSADNRIKLGDLGLSRYFTEQTLEAFSKVGTPLYMAPEVLLGDGYTFAADMWSLGCILYELCMLRSPFKPDPAATAAQTAGKPPAVAQQMSLYALFSKIKAGTYDPIPANGPYSQELRTLIDSLIRTNPDERPTVEQVCSLSAHMLSKLPAKQQKPPAPASTPAPAASTEAPRAVSPPAPARAPTPAPAPPPAEGERPSTRRGARSDLMNGHANHGQGIGSGPGTGPGPGPGAGTETGTGTGPSRSAGRSLNAANGPVTALPIGSTPPAPAAAPPSTGPYADDPLAQKRTLPPRPPSASRTRRLSLNTTAPPVRTDPLQLPTLIPSPPLLPADPIGVLGPAGSLPPHLILPPPLPAEPEPVFPVTPSQTRFSLLPPADVLCEEIIDRLALLNYREEYCARRRGPMAQPFTRFDFAVAAPGNDVLGRHEKKLSGRAAAKTGKVLSAAHLLPSTAQLQQFVRYASLSAWLLRLCRAPPLHPTIDAQLAPLLFLLPDAGLDGQSHQQATAAFAHTTAQSISETKTAICESLVSSFQYAKNTLGLPLRLRHYFSSCWTAPESPSPPFAASDIVSAAGQDACAFLVALCHGALTGCGWKVSAPVYPTPPPTETLDASDDEEGAMAEGTGEEADEIPEELGGAGAGAGEEEEWASQRPPPIEPVVPREEWLEEATRLAEEGKLSLPSRLLRAAGPEWRMRLDAMASELETLQRPSPAPSWDMLAETLGRLATSTRDACERIRKGEAALAGQYDPLLHELRESRTRQDADAEVCDSRRAELAALSEQLAHLNARIEEVRAAAEKERDRVEDSSPVTEIRRRVAQLKEESDRLDTRVGIALQQLIVFTSR